VSYTRAELEEFATFKQRFTGDPRPNAEIHTLWIDARRARKNRGLAKAWPEATWLMSKRERTAYLLGTQTEAAPPPPPHAAFTSDKKTGAAFSWRSMNRLIEQRQEMKRESAWSQKTARIDFSHLDHPICVIALSDTHIGSWGTDHTLLEKVVDEIMAVPNLYIAFLGDVAEMAVKMRSVAEVMGNMLDIEEQEMYAEDFLNEIAPRILFSTWDNHSIERAEQQVGTSAIAKLFSRRVVYHSGIGHPDIVVGNQTYRVAATHRFRGSSIDHPCHGGMRYLLREGNDREIALEGDKHRPGKETAVHSGVPKLALNSGTFNVNSGYGNRYFSLYTCPAFPCFTLHPDKHMFNDYWSVDHYLSATGQRAA
jgi:hypothetical protein